MEPVQLSHGLNGTLGVTVVSLVGPVASRFGGGDVSFMLGVHP